MWTQSLKQPRHAHHAVRLSLRLTGRISTREKAMYRSHARIAAENPQRLIKRLCNHWRHKFPVHLDEQGGVIELPIGRCNLRAVEGYLNAHLDSADQDKTQQLQKVVADHLARLPGEERRQIDGLSEVGQPQTGQSP